MTQEESETMQSCFTQMIAALTYLVKAAVHRYSQWKKKNENDKGIIKLIFCHSYKPIREDKSPCYLFEIYSKFIL
jgi:hypothetical protein